MYQASTKWGAYVSRTLGFTCTCIFVPGGPIYVRLKLKFPCTWAYADRLGFMRNRLSRLSVVRVCGRILSQRLIGKFLCVLHDPAMKWFLKVWIARLAAFCQYTCGGTSCQSIFCYVVKS